MRSKAKSTQVSRADARQQKPTKAHKIRRRRAKDTQQAPAQLKAGQCKKVPRKREAEKSHPDSSNARTQVTLNAPAAHQGCRQCSTECFGKVQQRGNPFLGTEWSCIASIIAAQLHLRACTLCSIQCTAGCSCTRRQSCQPANKLSSSSVMRICLLQQKSAAALCRRDLKKGPEGIIACGMAMGPHLAQRSLWSHLTRMARHCGTVPLSGKGLMQDAMERSVDAQQPQKGFRPSMHNCLDIDFALWDAAEVSRQWNLLARGADGAALPACLNPGPAGIYQSYVLYTAEALQCCAHSCRSRTCVWHTTQ